MDSNDSPPIYPVPDLEAAVSELLPIGLRINNSRVRTLQQVERRLFINGSSEMRPEVVAQIQSRLQRCHKGLRVIISDAASWPVRLTNGHAN